MTGGLAILFSFLCALVGIPLAIVAIVLGVRGRARATAVGAPSGMATAGMVLGIIAVGLSALWTIALMAAGTVGS